MSKRYSVDPELFQTFLANAFAVQESGLDRRSLSAVLEIQQYIASREFDLDEVMRMIADRAARVAQASGAAIGVLEPHRNELVYKTGSGCAAQDVGRRVPAVLCVSLPQEMRREILRVENAETDKRIEAEICRQFGATSLLMLPIYRNHALLGVLQVLFEKAHTFEDRELRAYRLMVGAMEEGMLRSSQRIEKPEPKIVQPIREAVHSPQDLRSAEPTPEPSTRLADAVLQNTFQDFSANHAESLVATGVKSARGYSWIVGRATGGIAKTLKRVVWRMPARPLSFNFPDAAGAIGAALVVSASLWIFHRGSSSQASIDLQTSGAHDIQLQAPVKPVFDAESPKLLSHPSKEISLPNPGFKRVRIGPNEIDYVTEDVTIRMFETRHAKPQVRSGAKEVDFGEDVTVRYFAKSPAASQPSSTLVTKPGKD